MKEQRHIRLLRFLVCAVVLTLVFEGLVRKLVGPSVQMVVFFLKDLLVLSIFFVVMRIPKSAAIQPLWRAYIWLILLFLPVVLATLIRDPLLAVFGAERYLLMPIVAFGVYGAFEDAEPKVVVSYLKKLGLLLLPTTALALLQLRLPWEHWVNRDVYGQMTTDFAAAGRLRVCSSFAFVSQFGMFLTMQVSVCAVVLSEFKRMKAWQKVVYGSLPFALLLSSYATASRGAVLGNATIALIAVLILIAKGKLGGLLRFGLVALALVVSFFALRSLFPEAFEGYAARERGQFLTLSDENRERTTQIFTVLSSSAAPVTLLGHGLGVMSNGAEKVSSYAASWRSGGFWTESDPATTLFEGGIYLVLVWYGFRVWVIVHTTRRVMQTIAGEYLIPLAFVQGYVILSGAIATLAIQPPAAIWWWMTVGVTTLLWQQSKATEGGDGATPSGGKPEAVASEGKIRGRSAYAEQLHGGSPR